MSFLDDLDIAVLAFVADHPDSTVTACAKTIFQPRTSQQQNISMHSIQKSLMLEEEI